MRVRAGMLSASLLSTLATLPASASQPSAPPPSLPPTLTLSTSYIPPYSIAYDVQHDTLQGYLGETVIGALEQAGLRSRIRIDWLPWRRAQADMQLAPNRLIFPLTRTPEREAQYRWISLLAIAPVYVYTADDKITVTRPEDLRHLSLGMLGGGAVIAETRRAAGVDDSHLASLSDERMNYRKLMLHRIDAWITQDLVASYVPAQVALEEGKPAPPLHRGPLLFEQPLWLAASRGTSDADIALLRQAIASFKKSKEYAQLRKKYGVN
jgi:polar amino acid transport system substrate-binding protein